MVPIPFICQNVYGIQQQSFHPRNEQSAGRFLLFSPKKKKKEKQQLSPKSEVRTAQDADTVGSSPQEGAWDWLLEAKREPKRRTTHGPSVAGRGPNG